MELNSQHIESLFRKWLANRATEEDNEQLFNILQSKEAEILLNSSLNNYWEEIRRGGLQDSLNGEERAQFILKKYPAELVEGEVKIRTMPHIHFLRTTWLRYAAVIIIMLGAGAYLWFNYASSIPANSKNLINHGAGIVAGSNKATLILADGSTIILENEDNGKTVTELTKNRPWPIVPKNETGSNGEGPEMNRNRAQRIPTKGYNIISTPNGGQYQIILPDGTKVWLNTASSITYPTAFVEKTREVRITGEVYFEIAKNKDKPFIVQSNKEKILVLGTSFNVNTYSDEPTSKTSLIDGLIKVNNSILKPGEAYQNGHIISTDIGKDIAWKNGYFNFEGVDLPTVMRQLARWYDIDIKYIGPITKRTFRGKLPRNLNLTDILEILREVNIKYQIENKTLFIE